MCVKFKVHYAEINHRLVCFKTSTNLSYKVITTCGKYLNKTSRHYAASQRQCCVDAHISVQSMAFHAISRRYYHVLYTVGLKCLFFNHSCCSTILEQMFSIRTAHAVAYGEFYCSKHVHFISLPVELYDNTPTSGVGSNNSIWRRETFSKQ